MGPEIVNIIIGAKDGSMAPVILNINQVLMGIQWALKIGLWYASEEKIKWIVNKFEGNFNKINPFVQWSFSVE